MSYRSLSDALGGLSRAALSGILIFGLVLAPGLFSPENTSAAVAVQEPAFQPGEMLRYDVSWSQTLRAGSADMEVREEILPDGRKGLAFVLTGRSRGLVERIFPVRDRVESIFDPESMLSVSYRITENFGRKKRNRSVFFDRENNTATGRLNEDQPKTVDIPADALDGLASLYILRTQRDFTVGKVFALDVHDRGKNWTIEVHTLGREIIKTPAGEFLTIKVKTRPLHNGVFENKGEAFIWLSDDNRKVPVLMKSTIKVGSFVFVLKEMRPGKNTIARQ